MKQVIFTVADLFSKLFSGKRQKALILRLDGMGDYVLFSPVFEKICAHYKSEGAHVSFLGNKQWQALYHCSEIPTLDKIYTIDIAKYKQNKGYRLAMQARFRMKGFRVLVNPTYSRSAWQDDFVANLNIPVKIASAGCAANMDEQELARCNKIYTEIIPADEKVTFEFIRNVEFASALTKRPANDFPFVCPEYRKKKNPIISKEYILVMPASGEAGKEWAPEQWANLLHFIKGKLDVPVYFLGGGKRDKMYIDKILSGADYADVFNVGGFYELDEIISIIEGSKFLISSDTGVYHLAALLKHPGFCVSNGKELIRFHPYPEVLNTPVEVIYPDEVYPLEENALRLREKFGNKWGLPMSELNMESVTETLERFMKRNADLT